jgi:hypothetical protein
MTNTAPDQAGSHPHHARRGSVGEANVERARLKRPNPIQWVWYAFGGGLPEGRREWVLHNVTAKTRSLRHLARSMVLIAPLVVGWLFVPVSLGLCLAIVLIGWAGGLVLLVRLHGRERRAQAGQGGLSARHR